MGALRSSFLLLASALLLGCGHVIYKAPNYGCKPFDFKQPPACDPAAGADEADDGLVGIRYLGAGGLAIRWRGQILLTAPFFSNYGFPRVPFGRLSPQEPAIRAGMSGIPPSEVGAILAGHSHYDHLGDLPVVAREHAPRARIYVNESGLKLLGNALGSRVESLERRLGEPVLLADSAGDPLPFRVRPLRSRHAPHVFRYHWAGGQVKRTWTKPFERLWLWHMRSGTTLAFVIDLLDEQSEVRYRVYYQDAASPAGIAAPPQSVLDDGHRFDLAVLCLPSYHLVEGAPEWLLRTLEPRHVLVIHYENFFRRDPMEFVAMLTDRRANDYLSCVDEVMKGVGATRGPDGQVCGPSGPWWTMPLPGELLRFRTRGSPASPEPCPPSAPYSGRCHRSRGDEGETVVPRPQPGSPAG